MSVQFKKAVKYEKPLKLAILGAAGSGKTYTGLMLGSKIAELRGGKMAVIDTERGSASLYADRWDYDVLEIEPPFTSERFIEAVESAAAAGYQVLVCDSMTHYWAGAGGILDTVDKLSRTKFSNNSYAAWSVGTPKHQAIIDAMLGSKLDIIATMRTKTKYIEGESNGRKAYIKAGVEPVQREGIDYEFDLVLRMNSDHEAAIDKGRFPDLDVIGVLSPPDENLAVVLIDILKGESAPEKPTVNEKVGAVVGASDMASELFNDPEIYNQFEDPAAVDRFIKYILTKAEMVEEEIGDPNINRMIYSAAMLYASTMNDGAEKKDALAHTITKFTEAIDFYKSENQADDIPF